MLSSSEIKLYCYNRCPQNIRTFLDTTGASPLLVRLANGAFWSLVGAVVSRILSLAAFVVIARVVGKEIYGQFGVVQSTISTFGVFAGFGLGQTATKYIAELRETDPQRAGRIMGMAGLVAFVTGSCLGVTLFAFAPWLAKTTLAAPELASALRIGAIILLFEAMNGSQIGALSGFEAFKATAKVSIWSGIASFPAMVAGVFLGGLEGAVGGLLLSRIFNWLLNHVALRNQARLACVPFQFEVTRAELLILWQFSIPSMLSGVMVSPTIWICNAMVVNQAGGYGQMGIFQAANTFKQILLFVSTTLGAPLLPLLVSIAGKHSPRFARANILLTWFVGVVPAVVLLGIPQLAQLIYGEGFYGSDFTKTFSLVVFGASVIVYKQGLARVLAAHGLMWWGMLSNLLWALTLVLCTWSLISWGAFGYAAAYAIAYCANTLLFIPLYTRKGLVPANTLLSIEAIAIWGVLLFGLLINLSHQNAIAGFVYIPTALASVCWLFWRLIKDESK